MIQEFYRKVLDIAKTKPWRLLGLSLLAVLLSGVAGTLTAGVVLLGIALGVLIDTAMTKVYLRGLHGEESQAEDLFDCFRSWDSIKRVLGGVGWSWLWIFLWGLIPIAGIVFATVRAYEYRLVPYILMNEPEIGIKEARDVSKQRTEGYKGKMFLADLLWIVAVAAVSLILLCFVGIRFLRGIALLVLAVFLIAVFLCSECVMGLIRAQFYERLTNPPQPEEKNHCASCGAELKAGDVFCSNCGTKVEH